MAGTGKGVPDVSALNKDSKEDSDLPDTSSSLRRSRASYAGWVTRALAKLDKPEIWKSPSLLELSKGRIIGSLKGLQTAHDKLTPTLDEDSLDQEQEWMEGYVDKVEAAVGEIDLCLQGSSKSPPRHSLPQDSLSSAMKGKEPAGVDSSVSPPSVSYPGYSSLNPQASQFVPQSNGHSLSGPGSTLVKEPIDSWIDKLIPGEETVTETLLDKDEDIARIFAGMAVQRDLPQVEIPVFDGSPLQWPKFVEQFHTQVHSRPGLNDARRMDILQSRTSCEAHKLIQGLGYTGRNYAQALQELKSSFGHRAHVARAYLNQIASGPVVPSGDIVAIRDLYISVRDCITTLHQLNYVYELGSSEVLQRSANRIPYERRKRWNDYVRNISRTREPTLTDLQTWLKDCVDSEFGPYAVATQAPKQVSVNKPRSDATRSSTQPTRHTMQTLGHTSVNVKSCPICSDKHHVSKCKQYCDKSVDERLALVKTYKLCFNCLYGNHKKVECTSSVVCRVDGCGKKHHTSLHRHGSSGSSAGAGDADTSRQGTSVKQVNSTNQSSGQVYLQVLPVVVQGQTGRPVSTFALLDAGSDISMISEDLCKELGLSGAREVLTVNTVNSTVSQPSTRVSFTIRSASDTDATPLEVDEAWTKRGHFDCATLKLSALNQFNHLKDLGLSEVHPQRVQLLVGANVPKAHLQREVREGDEDSPVAILTCLGWCVLGNLKGKEGSFNRHGMVNHLLMQEQQLDSQLERFWSTESFGVSYECKTPSSAEDRRAVKKLEEATCLIDNHYEVPMLWKDEDSTLPCNYGVALKRFNTLIKRLRSDEVRLLGYQGAMNDYIVKGYARKLSVSQVEEKSPRTWYLPHHCVINPKKPDKVRVVFDAAASLYGASLNNRLVTGPDLLNKLVGVLQRFRLRRMAVVSDVEAMFHQVLVPASDADSLRFLWKEDLKQDGPPEVFQMTVHIFGATDSPCCANYALQRTAHDNKSSISQLVYSTILHDFYVDDLLKAVDSVDEAISIVSEITSVMKKGGFRLTKWQSSSPDVLISIPEKEKATSHLQLDSGGPPIQRALGLEWNTSSDSFVFHPVLKEMPATKRGIVSAVSSIFDPCGFLAPFTFRGKNIIQEVWRLQLGWDDAVPDYLLVQWNDWLRDVTKLSLLSIPRVHPGLVTPADVVELHIFCDASELGFGSSAYFRCTRDLQVTCSFVAAKTHVAPLKHSLTIPKLELQGAVMGVRLCNLLKDELDLPVSKVMFWTDSMTVLRYINNESKRFKTFVCNRVVEIRASSHPSQWNHVPSESNPADACTRGLPAEEITMEHMWLRGPEFLWREEPNWPGQQKIEDIDDADENVKKTAAVNLAVLADRPFSTCSVQKLVDPEDFSSWKKLLVRLAWCLRAVNNFASACTRFDTDSITESQLHPAELDFTERCLIRAAQLSDFPEDFGCLSSGQELRKGSSILPLNPFYDGQCLRVGGRLRKATIPEEAKHQLLLPYQHHITFLIIRDCHLSHAHAGPEHVVALIRHKYWPIKCRQAVKKVVRKCLDCRRRTAVPRVPLMADLPASRVTSSVRPFQYAAVDYFGPLTVKRGRGTAKRWGCLFTCLVVRAVHLELAESLETDDFILVLRSFISRRGSPAELYSDNGTNFRGAQKELQQNLQAWNQERVSGFLVQRGIRWRFIPPVSPHFGGAWERLVRSVKTALKSVLRNQLVAEVVLRVTLTEVEAIVNSRPLTYNSSDPDDLLPITPSHFLYGGASPALPPGSFDDQDLCSRKRWLHSQVLTDHIWQRWLSEYLPDLTVRKRWTRNQRNLRINDLVLLVEERSPRGSWSLGRVLETMEGDDGRVRTVRVKTEAGVYTRPSAKVCFLEECIVDV